jgi:pilus assembly protein CpaB
MNRLTKTFLFLLIAGVLASLATHLSVKWLQRQATLRNTPTVSTERVVVADVYLTIGSKLTSNVMKSVPWPRESIPQGSFSDHGQLNNRVVKTTFYPGEPILESKLAPTGLVGGLSSVISDDKRAVTIKVSEVSGVAGFTLPGRRVDILVTINDERKKEPITKIILQNIKVLAVDQNIDRSGDKPIIVNAVTLEITPGEAEILAMATGEGRVHMALRNEVDTKIVATKGITKSNLIPSSPIQKNVKKTAYIRPNRSVYTIEIIKGEKRSKVQTKF